MVMDPPSKRRGLFFPAKNQRIARAISIKSPTAFRGSIRKLKKGGLTLKEGRSLVLARNRAKAQLGRRNLSPKERREFTTISRTRIPKFPSKR